MDNLRRQLDELKIARRTASAVGPRAAPVEPVTLEAILGGSELADGGWRCWQVARGQRKNACPALSVTSTMKEFLQRGQAVRWGLPQLIKLQAGDVQV